MRQAELHRLSESKPRLRGNIEFISWHHVRHLFNVILDSLLLAGEILTSFRT